MNKGIAPIIGIVGLIFVGLLAYMLLGALLGYWLEPVGASQVGIQFQSNKPVNVVGPGIYTDMSPFADIKRVETKELPFTVSDDEVLTHDLQRVRVDIAGTVRRPGLDSANTLIGGWNTLSTFYTDDTAVVGDGKTEGVIQRQGRQAIKVCVGDLDFAKAVVGSARDVLRECITTELTPLMAGYGLIVNPTNLVVPNVGLKEAVQKAMDDITNQRFAEQVARQGEQTAKATADQNLAVATGAIRVEQGKIQEQARQDALTADLNQKTLAAQRAVIEQQKRNDLYAAQQDLAINQAKASAAAESAKATNANTATLAAIYQANPAFAQVENTKNVSAAWHEADKIIVPVGSDPNLIINGQTQVVTPTR